METLHDWEGRFTGRSDFRDWKRIGSGQMGKVWRATHIQSGKKVAIKGIRRTLKNQGEIGRETAILSLLHHPNITRFYGSFETRTMYYLVMEYVEGDITLFEYILDHQGRLARPILTQILSQLLSAMAYLHAGNIWHRDIKCENILLRERDLHIKLADFGLSNVSKAQGEWMDTACGSLQYASPEMMVKTPHYDGGAADVWSLGVVIFAMACGHLPFGAMENDVELIRRVKRGAYTFFHDIDPDVKSMIQSILKVDPKTRPSVVDLWTHKLLKGHVPPKLPSWEKDEEKDEEEKEPARLSEGVQLLFGGVDLDRDQQDKDLQRWSRRLLCAAEQRQVWLHSEFSASQVSHLDPPSPPPLALPPPLLQGSPSSSSHHLLIQEPAATSRKPCKK